MISRKDIVSRFEDTVKQEIINHNREVESSNQRLNQLTEKLDKLSLYIEEKFSKITNFIAEKIQCPEKRIDAQSEQISENTKTLNDLIKFCDFHAQKINQIEKDIIEINNQIESIIVEQKQLSTDISHVHKACFLVRTELIGRMESNIHKVSNELKTEIENLKNKPSEALDVKEELLKKMEIDRVDFNGVMRELDVVKRTSFIQEKKIENIYTLIERIKKKLGE